MTNYTVAVGCSASGREWVVEVRVSENAVPVPVQRFSIEEDARRWADRLNGKTKPSLKT
jgi:hypothetical protein